MPVHKGKERLAGIGRHLGAKGWRPMELLLNGFEDDVHDETEATDRAGGIPNAAVEASSRVGEGGLHVGEVDARLRDEGEVGEVSVALRQERDEKSLAGSIEDLFVREVGGCPGFNDAVHQESQTGVGAELYGRCWLSAEG